MKQYKSKDGKFIIVREAVEGDAKTIERLINSVAAEKKFIVPERSREDWDVAIEEIRKRKSLIIVAQVVERTVAMAHLIRGKLEKNRHVGFLGISVFKRLRGIGIGTAMMDYMMDWAEKQKGLEKIHLTVFATNEKAINLYRKFGFTTEGVSKKQYRIEGKYVDDVMMARFLD